MNQKEQMFYEIGIVDFVVVELTEFLDTHPSCKEALEYFNHYSKIRNQMVEEFSQKYYPITANDAVCGKEWTWGEAPLPWEACAQGETMPKAACTMQREITPQAACTMGENMPKAACTLREGGC